MKNIILILVASLGICSLSAQKKIGGITLPANLSGEGSDLILNGAEIREKWFLDIYVGGLYLKAKNSSADRIIAANEKMGIRIHMVSGLITSEKMDVSTREGFEKSTGGKTGPIKGQIEQFIGVFTSEAIADGDFYDIVYVPTKGTMVSKNGKLKVTIEGHEFKKALFGIWLCNDPADEDLKEGMLGL